MLDPIAIRLIGHDDGVAAMFARTVSAAQRLGDAVQAGGRTAGSALDKVGADADTTRGALQRLSSTDWAEGAEGRARQFAGALDDARSKTENLNNTLGKVRNAGAGMAIAGGAAHLLSSHLIEVSKEGTEVEARLEAVLKAQGRLNDLNGINTAVDDVASRGHFEDDDAVRNATVLMANWEVKTKDMAPLLEAAGRQAQTTGQSVDEMANSFGKAIATGNFEGLKRSAVSFSETEEAAIRAGYAVSQEAGQMALVNAITAAVARTTGELGDGLTDAQKRANDFSRAADDAMTNVGAGALSARADVAGLAGRMLALGGGNEGAQRAAGYILEIGSGALTAIGGIAAFTGQLGQSYLALKSFQAARAASSAASGVAAATSAANAAAQTAEAAAMTVGAAAATADATATGIDAAASGAAAETATVNAAAQVAEAAAMTASGAAAGTAAIGFGTLAAAAALVAVAIAGFIVAFKGSEDAGSMAADHLIEKWGLLGELWVSLGDKFNDFWQIISGNDRAAGAKADEAEAESLRLTNEYRAKRGLAPLAATAPDHENDDEYVHDAASKTADASATTTTSDSIADVTASAAATAAVAFPVGDVTPRDNTEARDIQAQITALTGAIRTETNAGLKAALIGDLGDLQKRLKAAQVVGTARQSQEGIEAQIRSLQSRIHKETDTATKKAQENQLAALQEQLRTAKAATAREEDAAKTTTAAAKISSSLANERTSGQAGVDVLRLKLARDRQKDNEKASLEERLKSITDQADAGMMDKDAATAEKSRLSAAFEQRNKALDAAEAMAVTRIQAQADIAKAIADHGNVALARLHAQFEIQKAQMAIDFAGAAGSAPTGGAFRAVMRGLGGTPASAAEIASQPAFNPNTWSRDDGADSTPFVTNYASLTEGAPRAAVAPAFREPPRAIDGGRIVVNAPQPTQRTLPSGKIEINFGKIEIDNQWQRAMEGY